MEKDFNNEGFPHHSILVNFGLHTSVYLPSHPQGFCANFHIFFIGTKVTEWK